MKKVIKLLHGMAMQGVIVAVLSQLGFYPNQMTLEMFLINAALLGAAALFSLILVEDFLHFPGMMAHMLACAMICSLTTSSLTPINQLIMASTYLVLIQFLKLAQELYERV